MVTSNYCAGISVFSRQDELLTVKIILSSHVPSVHGLGVQLIAYSQIQRQAPRDPPVILQVRAGVNRSQPAPLEHSPPGLLQRGKPHQEIRPRITRPGVVGTGAENRTKVIRAEAAGELVEPVTA